MPGRKHITRRRFISQCIASGAALVGAGFAEQINLNGPRSHLAAPLSDFLDSIGVCSSIAARAETLQGTIEAIRYAGISFVRCGLEDGLSTDQMIELYQRTGARIAYGLLSGGSDLGRLIQQARELAKADALLALEGNNEPNNWPVRYQGQLGGGQMSWLAVARLQNDLYEAVKADPILRSYPVWNISEAGAQTDNVGLQFLTIPKAADTIMPAGTRYADYANCHNYLTHPSWPGLHDNQTWLSASPGPDCPVDGLYKNYGLTWHKGFNGYSPSELINIPRVTTETGCPTGQMITEQIQAKLIVNLYLSQFSRLWSYTAVYLLRARSGEPDHQRYAMFEIDYTPKLAAHYLHNLTSILQDQGPARQVKALEYHIPDQSPTVHDMLLQRSDGTLFIVLWGERFTGGLDQVAIQLGRRQQKITIYDVTSGTRPVEKITDVRSLTVPVADHPLILELSV